MQRFGIDAPKAMDGLRAVARNAGWWWAFRGLAVLADRPSELHRDKDGRLHSATGPAICYRDGFGLHLWHGTRVPADLITTDWSTERIFQEPNAEIRRCAIEKIGWAQFIAREGFARVGEPVPDPGNAPHTLALYELPEKLHDMYEERARILLCTNGSEERDGSRHQFGLVVEARHSDPVAAAASLYDVPVEAYRQLQVRR